MITVIQCKMARSALGWGVRELAKRAHLGVATVVRFESGTSESNASTMALIQQAFETAGVRFTGGGVLPPEEGGDK